MCSETVHAAYIENVACQSTDHWRPLAVLEEIDVFLFLRKTFPQKLLLALKWKWLVTS